ncbi:putative glycerophosphocholine phosphodiesterase GPCPD1 homolog 2 [Anastrepha obliqua]|uniref:putative glycerophosphocholine phosphodiesterase GPCPD1 homolog 2 n=1 Tax=Anastrepha obliqua TaxID=95512 RepID=UPI00240A246C|nr:putative glycerophosphocholine phosphodiesterase GPCPD1 homolog 2 [Anastrepha obliqua]
MPALSKFVCRKLTCRGNFKNLFLNSCVHFAKNHRSLLVNLMKFQTTSTMTAEPAASVNFTVNLSGIRIALHEVVGVMGNQEALGDWDIQLAPLLKRSEDDYNEWSGVVELSLQKLIRYRYFIAAVDKATRAVQVRRWEAHERAREIMLQCTEDKCVDRFGCMCPNKPKVRKAWLNTGHVVLFKLFHALEFKENFPLLSDEEVRIKLEPVHPEFMLPLLPSARAYVQYSSMLYGGSQMKDQPDLGVVFKNDTLLFQVITVDKALVGYLMKLNLSNESTGCVQFLGQQYISPEALNTSEGQFTVSFNGISNGLEVAKLQINYLVVNAMPEWKVQLNTTFLQYWPNRWKGLDIGHRGMGRSFIANNPAPITENTLLSMNGAFKAGADMVEFDVMLTRDMVPIIFHDFDVLTCTKLEAPITKDDLSLKAIKDFTYEELQHLTTYQIVNDEIVEYAAPNSLCDENERLFPTLKEFFAKTNRFLGCNMDIKWPQAVYKGGVESIQTIDKNDFVEAILQVVKEASWGRVCCFSSFDADICIMLRFKQNMYPVFLLVSKILPGYLDPRTHCLHPAVSTAQAFDLNGIVPAASIFKTHPDAVALANRQNKWVMLWDDELRDRASVDWYKQQGVHGVIYDRIESILDNDKRNIFAQDEKLQRLFGLQLSCVCR